MRPAACVLCPLTGSPAACLYQASVGVHTLSDPTDLRPRYVPISLNLRISANIPLFRSVSIFNVSSGSSQIFFGTLSTLGSWTLRSWRALGGKAGADSGVAAGRGETIGEERYADRAVIWGSVSSETLHLRCIWSRARMRGAILWPIPKKLVKAIYEGQGLANQGRVGGVSVARSREVREMSSTYDYWFAVCQLSP